MTQSNIQAIELNNTSDSIEEADDQAAKLEQRKAGIREMRAESATDGDFAREALTTLVSGYGMVGFLCTLAGAKDRANVYGLVGDDLKAIAEVLDEPRPDAEATDSEAEASRPFVESEEFKQSIEREILISKRARLRASNDEEFLRSELGLLIEAFDACADNPDELNATSIADAYRMVARTLEVVRNAASGPRPVLDRSLS
jgi:hypothetical protein